METDLLMLKHKLSKVVCRSSDSSYYGRDIFDLAMLAAPEPFLYAMVRLLFIGEIQDDYGSLDYLRSAYVRYKKKHYGCSFALEDLFAEGWLLKSMDEWRFTGFRSNYTKLQDLNEREKNICEFIASLPYNRETGLVHVDVTGEDFACLSQDAHRKLSWFLEKGLLSFKEQETKIYTLAESSELWKALGSKALGIARTQGMKLERVLHLAHALHLHPRPSDLPAGDCDEHKDLLDALASDKLNWDQMEKILLTACRLQYRSLNEEQRQWIAMPSAPRLRYNWLWRTVYEPLCHISRDTWRDDIFYYFLRRYNSLGQIDRQRFCRLFCHPFYQIMLVESHVLEPLVECLEDSRLPLVALLPLTEALQAEFKEVGYQASSGVLAYFWELHPAPKDVVEYLVFLSIKAKMRGSNHQGYVYLYRELMSRVRETASPDLIQGCLEYVSGQVASASAVDTNHYFLLLLDLSRAVNRIPATGRQEAYEKIYQAVVRWLQRNLVEDLLLSTLPKDSWEKADWSNILKASLAESTGFFDNIGAVLTVEGLQTLQHGKLAECYLRLGLLWLTYLSKCVESSELDLMQVRYVEFFFSSHEKVLLFSGDYLDIFQSEETLALILQYYPHLGHEAKDTFIQNLKSIDDNRCVDLILWFPYIDNKELQAVFLERLPKVLPLIKENVSFYPTLRAFADVLVEIGLGLHEEGNQADTLQKIVASLQDIQATFESARQKLDRREEGYNKWIDSLRYRILLLDENWSELEKNDFYRACHCLKLGDYESLRVAERVLAPHYENGEVSYAFNYMIAEALLVEALIEKNDSYVEELDKFNSVIVFLDNHIKRIRPTILWQLAYYKLKISIMTAEAVAVYECYWSLEEKYRLELHCAKLMADFLLKQKDYILLREITDKLKVRYGDTESIKELVMHIALQKNSGSEDTGISRQDIAIPTSLERDFVEDVRRAFDDFRRMSNYQKAEVMLRPQVDLTSAAKYAAYPGSSGLMELFVLRTVLYVAYLVESYSDRLIFDGKTGQEDTYNKLMAEFLESYGSLILRYNAYDQTQEGARNDAKAGYKTPGELDIMLKWDDMPIAIIEGIKFVQGKGFPSLDEHIDKLPEYNRRNIKMAFMLVYTTASDMNIFESRYIKKLNSLKDNGKCSIQEIKKSVEMDWPIQGLNASGISFVCTRHNFSEKGFDKGTEMHVYHVFIQIQRI